MKHVNPEDLSHSQLVDHVILLQEYVEALTASIDIRTAHLQRILGLTPLEAQILQLMGDGTVRTKEQIMTALYWDRIADGEVPAVKIIDVWVCKTRKKLAGTGIVIQTMWGRGYWLEGTDKLKKVMAGEEPERDLAAPGAVIGKPAGGVGRPKGSVLVKALEVFREHQSKLDGRVYITSRELSAKAGVSGPPGYLRELERRNKLVIHHAPKPGTRRDGGMTWVLELR